MSTAIILRALSPHSDWAVLERTSVGPAISGSDVNGTSGLCPHCGSTIYTDVTPGAILNVGFKCASCGGYCHSDVLSPGHSLFNSTLLVQKGQLAIDPEIILRATCSITGVAAHEQWSREVGLTVGRSLPAVAMDQHYLATLLEKAKTLLAEKYTELARRDNNGVRSKTPAARRHRLIELVKRIARTIDDPSIPYDVAAISELNLTLDAIRRWSGHPYWSSHRKDLFDLHSYSHCVAVFVAASILTGTNYVELNSLSRNGDKPAWARYSAQMI